MNENSSNKKTAIIEKFINANATLAVQGSKKWLEERSYTIGGSEISVIMGCNSFSKIPDLVASKVGLDAFSGSTPTRWGNLFENVSEMVCKIMFVSNPMTNNKIYSTGSIPNKTIENHKYSPDGLCVIKFENIKNKIEDKITLLEFKSPFSTVPGPKIPKQYLPQVKAGLCTIDIAETALFVNNMFRKCSLKDLNFSMKYDDVYHKDELKLKDINDPIAYSIMLISINQSQIPVFLKKMANIYSVSNNANIKAYSTNLNSDLMDLMDDCSDATSDSDSDNNDDDNNNDVNDDGTKIIYKFVRVINQWNTAINNGCFGDIKNFSESLVDLGSESRSFFDQFLELYKNDEDETPLFNIKYIKPNFNKKVVRDGGNGVSSTTEAKNLIIPYQLNWARQGTDMKKRYNYQKIIMAYCEKCVDVNDIPIAVLPWKLLRSSNIIVEKENDFLDKIKSDIDFTINIVKDINTRSTNMSDKARLLEEYFPDNYHSKKYFELNHNHAEFLDEFE
jgi:hypothetical protein